MEKKETTPRRTARRSYEERNKDKQADERKFRNDDSARFVR